MYLKFGFPFRNSEIGITAFSLMDSKQISVSGQVKLWSQEDYGKGFFLGSTAGCRLADRFGLQLQVGYKTAGNVVDQTIQSGFLVSGSMNYISKNF
ncbi:MAG: hypothetical protein NZL95_04870 [Chitinophagales bacterium]|nr:hypothetical protein [Chitinophagales bacterium]MDW8427866.1 hypothetical protein [Chitinophagales bacterium]